MKNIVTATISSRLGHFHTPLCKKRDTPAYLFRFSWQLRALPTIRRNRNFCWRQFDGVPSGRTL